VTIVLVTHDPYEATTLCHSALILGNGHLAEIGTWKDLLSNPQSELLRIFRAHLGRAELVPPQGKVETGNQGSIGLSTTRQKE